MQIEQIERANGVPTIYCRIRAIYTVARAESPIMRRMRRHMIMRTRIISLILLRIVMRMAQSGDARDVRLQANAMMPGSAVRVILWPPGRSVILRDIHSMPSSCQVTPIRRLDRLFGKFMIVYDYVAR